MQHCNRCAETVKLPTVWQLLNFVNKAFWCECMLCEEIAKIRVEIRMLNARRQRTAISNEMMDGMKCDMIDNVNNGEFYEWI